jgi:hypothetical protein
MKKLILSLVLISFSTAILFAQAPEKVQATFKAKYPDATAVAWSTGDNGTYLATYTDRTGAQNTVVLNGDGKVVRTEVALNENDYPGGVKEYYVKKYPDEKNYHVWVVTDENGDKTYYTREHGARIYFDKAGNFLKEEKEKVKDEMKEHSDDK